MLTDNPYNYVKSPVLRYLRSNNNNSTTTYDVAALN
uniref:Uncharacterized protein n=1 Tax=Moniliophthora roreri TaxID=221103 RepID=A0A0W0F009_MONRR